MAIDVEDLLIQPFRELVEKGKEAVENGAAAEDEDAELSKQMVKASKSVVKEGERALKRLQPLWDSQVEKHGDSFKVSMALNRMSALPSSGFISCHDCCAVASC